MKWKEIRAHYPRQWLLVEAIKAHSESGKRILEQLAVVSTFPDSPAAMEGYKQLHRQSPERELYVLHTDRETLEITERRWLGVRGVRVEGIVGMDFLQQVGAIIDLAQLEIYGADAG